MSCGDPVPFYERSNPCCNASVFSGLWQPITTGYGSGVSSENIKLESETRGTYLIEEDDMCECKEQEHGNTDSLWTAYVVGRMGKPRFVTVVEPFVARDYETAKMIAWSKSQNSIDNIDDYDVVVNYIAHVREALKTEE